MSNVIPFADDDAPTAVTRELMDDIMSNFQIPSSTIHGPTHWARVRKNGLLLCPYTGADPIVVELFAVLHDSQRIDEGEDIDHGPRAAEYAISKYRKLFDILPHQLNDLVNACIGHTKDRLASDNTIQTCWDADRLDIGRTGIGLTIDPFYLGTAAAKNAHMIAYAMSASRDHPDRPYSQIRQDLANSLPPYHRQTADVVPIRVNRPR